MLDIREIRDNADAIIARLNTRGGDFGPQVREVLECDEIRRKSETEQQALLSQRKQTSKQIGMLKAKGEDTSTIEAEVRGINDQIAALEETVVLTQEKQERLLKFIPNTPHPECPVGADETANPVVREWGEKPAVSEPKDHLELAEALGLISLEDGARIAGSGFAVYRGRGARLERALINFLLDLQTTQHGYEEVNVPHIIKRECMEGTGQLPKFEEDMYGTDFDGEQCQMFLAPTAEVPVTNLFRDTILSEEELPKKLCAHTPCFRREAGSAGRDNRGIIRMHQFDKVELVQVVHPDHSFEMLEELLGHAQAVLETLGLHYRTIELCTGDVGFSSTKTYDIEVWAPGQGKYLEVSSCSNFGDYQARRMKLRFKGEDKKNRFCHTLNGSGTALPRLYVAILEQGQQPDGSIKLPAALVPYFGAEEIR
ncbi:seryl-tRNA synthetase [Haloferula luteola]|uniref:Serine--tRNA ligase n=1 Tax=Haloferula luteola TaxID=595692 RepID=A0A840V6S3_9BACT|nr:serine--tRNA ligase [Haloferula luteola]MBB5350458.1 seryl-tRNA synthetase [Haloferula luteola]